MTKGTWIVAAAGLFGALGVAGAAGAAHSDPDGLLGPASTMLLAHAPSLIALYAARTQIAFIGAAAFILFLGTLVFAADLGISYFSARGALPEGLFTDGLFPMAAPIGGVLMIAGWLVIIVCSFFPLRRN